jgi:MFS family permease
LEAQRRSIELLVIGRILQDLATAILCTVGTALLVDTVGHAEIGQMLGWVSLSLILGILLAPLVGGVVYERAGYVSCRNWLGLGENYWPKGSIPSTQFSTSLSG